MAERARSHRRPVSAAPRLAQRIALAQPRLTPSERAIAQHVLANLHLLPFENAAAIAAKVGVSPMTVSRFLRTIGYGGIGELKDELRGAAADPGLLVTGRVERLRANAATDDALHENLQLEVDALVGVYEQVGTPRWQRAIERLATCDQVFVAGFQTLGGLAADFAARLQYLRPGVSFVDGRDGTFAEPLAGSARTPCVVLFEMRRYTRFSPLLAALCRQRGIPVLVVCDRHCHWAHGYTDELFAVATDSRLFWDSQAPFLSLTNLMLDHVARRLQPAVQARLNRLRDLQEHFGAFR
jgi:DNA-binding MurR/RpiR family transcriptional regulator